MVVIDEPQAWSFAANIFPDGGPAAADGPETTADDPLLVAPQHSGLAADFKVEPGSPTSGAGSPEDALAYFFVRAARCDQPVDRLS